MRLSSFLSLPAFGKMCFWISEHPPYIIKLANVMLPGDTWTWETL